MDFEINKTATPCMDSTGPFPVKCTIDRSVGDILVTFDFTNRGGNPSIGLRTWNGSSWQPDSSVVAEAAVNGGNVLDSHANLTLPANTFGEASIDLTASGLLSAGSCDFGQATTFLKSRSSASFTSEIKDYVAPISTPLVPCKGAIQIAKTAKDHSATGGTAPLAGAVFTVNGVQKTTDANGTACWDNLSFGSYTVHEVSAPTGYSTAADTTVKVSTQGDCSSGATNVPITDTPLSAIDLTFHSLAGAGVTAASSVKCASVEKGPLADGDSATYTNLAPGTYTCTIVIDP